jgi:hypothetical protein
MDGSKVAKIKIKALLKAFKSHFKNVTTVISAHL